jgi:hypothetical protein
LQSKLQAEGLDNETMLDETIKKLETDLKKARKKEAGETDEITVRPTPFSQPPYSHSQQEEPSFPLVDVPDADVRAPSRLLRIRHSQTPHSSTRTRSRRRRSSG